MNNDRELLQGFIEDESERMEVISFMSELPDILSAVNNVIISMNKQRLAFMFLLLKTMIDSGNYVIEANEEELSYYVDHALKVTKENNAIKVEVIFSGEKKEDDS